MAAVQLILAVIFPPLAVVDRGCGSFLVVFLLSCFGWGPGCIAALLIILTDNKQ